MKEEIEKERTYRISKEDLLFLHLFNHNDNVNEYIADYSQTEKGIKDALECDLGYISRLIKQNEKNGLIYRRKMRIKEESRKMDAFFLTGEGKKLAKELIGKKFNLTNI